MNSISPVTVSPSFQSQSQRIKQHVPQKPRFGTAVTMEAPVTERPLVLDLDTKSLLRRTSSKVWQGTMLISAGFLTHGLVEEFDVTQAVGIIGIVGSLLHALGHVMVWIPIISKIKHRHSRHMETGEANVAPEYPYIIQNNHLVPVKPAGINKNKMIEFNIHVVPIDDDQKPIKEDRKVVRVYANSLDEFIDFLNNQFKRYGLAVELNEDRTGINFTDHQPRRLLTKWARYIAKMGKNAANDYLKAEKLKALKALEPSTT